MNDIGMIKITTERGLKMSRNEVKEKIVEIFKDIFDDDQLVIEEETSAEDIEDWDSLMHISLITAIQKCFDVQFKLKEVTGLKNVGETIDLILEKIDE